MFLRIFWVFFDNIEVFKIKNDVDTFILLSFDRIIKADLLIKLGSCFGENIQKSK